LIYDYATWLTNYMVYLEPKSVTWPLDIATVRVNTARVSKVRVRFRTLSPSL